MRNVLYKLSRENQNTYFIISEVFSLENLTVFERMWKKYSRARESIDDRQYGARAFHAEYLRLQTYTKNM